MVAIEHEKSKDAAEKELANTVAKLQGREREIAALVSRSAEQHGRIKSLEDELNTAHDDIVVKQGQIDDDAAALEAMRLHTPSRRCRSVRHRHHPQHAQRDRCRANSCRRSRPARGWHCRARSRPSAQPPTLWRCRAR